MLKLGVVGGSATSAGVGFTVEGFVPAGEVGDGVDAHCCGMAGGGMLLCFYIYRFAIWFKKAVVFTNSRFDLRHHVMQFYASDSQ